MSIRSVASFVKYFTLSAVGTILALGALRTPAAAADTSYLTLQGPNTVVAPCPITLTFNGSITGPGNSSVTYLWARFVNGKPQDSASISTTIPGNGTLTLMPPPQLTIDATTQGFQSYSLFITSPAGSDSTTHGKVFFTATCGTPPPTPSPSPGLNFHNPLIYQLAPPDAPTGLKVTNNEQECGLHGYGIACPIAMQAGDKILVWCWGQAGCNGPASTSQGVKAFNVYEVDNGKHVRLTSVPPDSGGNIPTASAVDTPQGGFTNQCYAATVVMSDNRESGRSNVVCLGSGTVGNVSDNYGPTDSTIRSQSSQYGNVPFRADCNTQMCVGWHHDQSSIIAPNIIPIWWYADNVRAYYRFDQLGAISGHYIASATLTVIPTQGRVDCFSALAAADTDWRNNPNTYIGGNFNPPAGTLAGGMDVTDIVRAWVSGNTPNYGFVLRGSNENLVAESSECRTELGNATLTVTHS